MSPNTASTPSDQRSLYSAFGGVLASSIQFPELPSIGSAATPTWLLTKGVGGAPPQSIIPIGEESLEAGASVRLGRVPAGLRVEFSDSGVFDLFDSSRRIVWYPHENSNEELARLDFLGRVLAVAAHDQGKVTLHASAVTIGGKAIAFLAAKGSGKSTLALSLIERGAKLLTDDTLPVDSERRAHPGVHSVRVWGDSVQRFRSLGSAQQGLASKYTMTALDASRLQYDAVPLAAVYALMPQVGDGVPLVERVGLGATAATIMMMQHSKLGPLLGGAESRVVFDRCSAIAESIPAYQLNVARDLSRVSEVADALIRWHS